MIHWKSEITYPFIYLDSSYLLRTTHKNTEYITRRFYKNNPDRCKRIIKELQLESQKDNDYHKQIIGMQQKGRLSTFITMETLNSYVQLDHPEQIALFGALNISKPYEISNQQTYGLDGVVLWEESVDLKTFNKAAVAIANAECVIADAAFFKVSAGKSLAEYIMTGCHFIITPTNGDIEIEGNYTLCELPPYDLIMNLSSDF